MLDTQVLPRQALNSQHEKHMFALFEQYYSAVNFVSFKNDLRHKDYVLLLQDSSGQILGFSTLEIIEFEIAGTTGRALFSGDTIIHHEHWGSQALSKAWCQLAGTIKAGRPDEPLYWFLIVKGHRTYRYLPVFTRTFFPHYKHTTPELAQKIMDHLSQQKFGGAYLQDQGLVHYPQSHGHLKTTWADIPAKHLKNRHVQYFLQRNPNYQQGDELVCLTELSTDNMCSVALHMFKAGLYNQSAPAVESNA